MTRTVPLAAKSATLPNGGAARAHLRDVAATTFAILFARHRTEMAEFVGTLVRDEHVAAEVCAEVWEDVWRGMAAFRSDARFRAWIYVIARNACFRYRTHAARRREWSLSDARTARLAFHPPTEPSIAELRREALLRLRDALPDDDRTLLVLRVDFSLRWDDIARILGGAEPYRARAAALLRKRFERLKKRLRAKLTEQGGE